MLIAIVQLAAVSIGALAIASAVTAFAIVIGRNLASEKPGDLNDRDRDSRIQ